MSQFKGRLAQRLEQGTHNPLVEGSNPPAPTNLPMTNNNTNHRDVNQVPKNFVYNLRRSGIKVRIKHYRWVYDHNTNDYFLAHVTKENKKYLVIDDARGGRTGVEVTMQNGKSYSANAICHYADNYNKRYGVYTAATRALKAAKEDAKLRKCMYCKILIGNDKTVVI